MAKQRNTGIDTLRIISSFMVLILHILGEGGLLEALPGHSLHYKAAWTMEIACYCAVNCFGLISGFVGCNSRSSWSGILRTWLQVLFYTVGAAVILHFFIPEVITLDIIRNSFFPVTNRIYWYYTAYFCVSFFAPAMNHLILTLPRRQLRLLVITGAVLLSIIPTWSGKDLFYTKNGYSALWLMYLYIFGGYLSMYSVSKASSRKYLCFYFVCVALTSLHKLYPDFCGPLKSMPFLEYTSPTILACAVCLVIFLSQCDFPKFARSVIHFIAPLSFAVYLLHAQDTVFIVFMENKFGPLGQQHTIVMILSVLATASFWFLLGIAVEYIRQKLFNLLKISTFCKKIDLLQEKCLSFSKSDFGHHTK